MYLEFTSTSIHNSFLFFVLIFACILSSFSLLFLQWGIIYSFFSLDILVLCTVPIQDILQNLSVYLLLFIFFFCIYIWIFLNTSFLHSLLCLAISSNMSCLSTLIILSSIFLFFQLLAILCYVFIYFTIKILWLSIFEVLI